MKRFFYPGLMLAFLLAAGPALAQGLSAGKYVMNSGTMQVTMEVNTLPDGKYFINANGSGGGKNCRIGDLGELRGGSLVLGVCEMGIRIGGDGFDLQDARGCAQCDPGASVSGHYVKK
ncbi:MAG: hypothetical protein CVU61_07085 [Deltaproteobacteria bacterium HGW-Deltaproteobacteria-19]|jgi:hypothetical protein|nr:MAG: hypothetical protein CVU61_07085 [Deltaproteobacteria bacterium HGW-Deltaproteobacteria-19]